jgi:hypothetical protein
MAMKHPIFGWPSRTQPTDTPVEAIFNDLVYDDPTDDPILKLEVPLPAVPPRVESKTVSTPPLPPRRFKKLNQPLPDPPTRDLGLKSALQALKQTFKKAKPMSKSEASLNSSVSIHSSQRSIYNSQESVRDAHQNASAMDEQTSQSEPDTVKSDNEAPSEQKLNESPVIQTALPTVVVDQVDPDNLTEAENYALYMRLAPLATASEFDENETLSMLYGELTPNRDVVSMQDGK